VPESFKVLVKELQSLCLDISVLDEQGRKIDLKGDEGDDMSENMRDRSFYKSSDEEFVKRGYSVQDVELDEVFEEDPVDDEEVEVDSELEDVLDEDELFVDFEDIPEGDLENEEKEEDV
jgi:DNA-directed RNA polymerase subunit beta